jgi:hypothetical protein
MPKFEGIAARRRGAPLQSLCAFALACFCNSYGAGAATSPVELPAADLDWRYYQSPNFELYSTQAEKDSRELLHNLELLRAVVFERFKIVERTRLEVTVFAFSKPEHFAAYLSPRLAGAKVAAYYFAHPDRAIICMGPGAVERAPVVAGPLTLFTYSTPARHVIFHEYIHHLFRATNQHPTVWFNEGFAELLAPIQVKRDHIELGHDNTATLFLLQNQKLLPWETIFGAKTVNPLVRDHGQSVMFYAQSWAFLHYLYFGEAKPPAEQVARFMNVMSDRRRAAKIDAAEYFRECFGYDFQELSRRIDKYVANGKYRYGSQSLPQLAPESSYVARRPEPIERRVRLAELAARVPKSAAGKVTLLEAQEQLPHNPRVHEVLGAVAFMDNDPQGATEHWEKAVELGTKNIAIARELTLLECRGLFARFDFDRRLPAAKTEQLRERLLASIRQEPAQSAAYEMLALVEAFSEAPRVANVNLVQEHFKQLSEKARTVVALAMVRVRLGKPAEAEEILAQLDELRPDPATAKIADAIRSRLLAPTGRAATRPANP